MGLADWIRVMRGHLTPEEIAERDERVRARRKRAEEAAADRAAGHHSRELYQQRLRRAAGISSVTLVCHADTWDFIDRRAAEYKDWISPRRTQGRVTSRNGLLEVRLSGPQVVVALIALADAYGVGSTFAAAPWIGDRSIAGRLYHAIGVVVDTVDPDAAAGNPVPPIVIDDQAVTDPADERS